jgi:hypothetical protein
MLMVQSASTGSSSCAYLYTSVSGSAYGHFFCDSISSSYEVIYTSGDSNNTSFSPLTISSSDESTSSRRTRSSQPLPSDTDDSSTSTRTRLTQPTPSPTESEESSTTDASTAPTTSTSRGPAVAPSASTTNAGAIKTAEAVVGAVGGAVGLLALFL